MEGLRRARVVSFEESEGYIVREPDMRRAFDGGHRRCSMHQAGRLVGDYDIVMPPHARRAWRVIPKPKTIDQTATMAQWLVHCPHLHAFWGYWWINLIHLRDIPGVVPAHKHFPQAEYELAIYAQNPEREPDPDNLDCTMAVLLPADVCEQFHGVTDEQAIDLVEVLVRGVVNWTLSPDSDFRQSWKSQISLCVEHVTTGHSEADA